jgi:hypothetical protein
MDTDYDIRRRALEEAAVEMCGYCRGSRGHDPVPVKAQGRWQHLFLKGNGANPCASGPLWEMVLREKSKRELMRRMA